MGQSAIPCRSARSHRFRDFCAQSPSRLESAVELRLGKKSAGQFQDFIGTAQFLVLSLQGFDVLAFFTGDTLTQAGVDFQLANPFMQCLRNTADLGGN